MSGHVRLTDQHLVVTVAFVALLLFPAAGLFAYERGSFDGDLKLAHSGEAKAMTALARRYEHGEGCARDAGQAMLWYQRAADRNEPGAMVALGNIYDEGKCVDQNMARAVRYFRQAAALGDGQAMFRLGQMIENGRGILPDKDEARGWYAKAAALGVAPAMTAIGWYRKAADAGHAPAFALLAASMPAGQESQKLLEKGAALGDPPAIHALAKQIEATDATRALELYRRAAEARHPAAMGRYATLIEPENAAEAALWYERAAEANDPVGLTWLGKKTEPKSGETAHAIYERAVAQGYVPAMTRMGVLRADCPMMRKAGELGDVDGMFEYASRCTPDDAEAWFRKAAERNHVEALARIGETRRAAEAGHRPSIVSLAKTDPAWMRRAADAGEPEAMRRFAATLTDPGDAARWYKRAAEAGDVPAMTETARRFEKGFGVAADRHVALDWYRRAAGKNDREAMYRLGILTSDMSWVRKAADAGFPEAMCKLGESLGESPKDREEKLALFRKAADAGYVNGWTRIGVVTNDEAVLERAAQLGDAEAKLRLGEMQFRRKKRREAFKLFQAAAEAGYAPAMVRVGDCHLNGDGASVSEIDAVNWYRRAALAGDEQAVAKLKQLGKTQ
jgi:uncharacterized protein